jgi:serine/threonine protein kinase
VTEGSRRNNESDMGSESDMGLSRNVLLGKKKQSFKVAQNTRADVSLIDLDGKQVIYKDYTDSSKGFSLLLAPFLVYRETKALRQLQGVKGIPGLVSKVDSRSFLMEFVPAQRIRFVYMDLDWSAFIPKTEDLVQQLHARGVIHGDLRNATNILVDRDHNPVFVDFVSAVHRGHRYNPFSWALFKLCLAIDRGAMYKLKDKYAPELVSETERNSHTRRGPFERTARWFSVRIRNLIQKIFP